MALTEQNLTNLPQAPVDTKAVAGKDTLLYIALSTSPLEWLLVGGQKNSAMNQKADSLDGTDKSSGGWSKKIGGMKSWTIDYDGLFVINDETIDILNYCFRNSKAVYIRQEYPDGSYRTGYANITSFDDSHASDAISTIKITLEGYGAISDVQVTTDAAIATPTLTVVKAATVDKTVSVTPADCTIRALTDAAENPLIANTDYTFAGGTLTIKGTYLAKLDVGSHMLTAKFATGTIAITITITAA
jgi:TP901-1 family phage major tail protein